MAESGFKFAGYVNVKRVELYSLADPNNRKVDLTQNFLDISLKENMQSAFIHGEMSIIDSYGMIYSSIDNKTYTENGAQFRFPHIKGEEYLLITYEDDRSDLEYTEQYYVYAVDDIRLLEDRKETALQYKLHFVSPQKFFANTRRIRKAYRNMTISDMVADIFEEYYQQIPVLSNNIYKKDIEIEQTTGHYTITIPNLTPEDALLFLARRAYSSTNKSSLFFFFETRQKFYFFTHEGLKIKNRLKLNTFDERASGNPYIFTYTNTAEDNTVEGQNIARQTLSRATLSPVNSQEHIAAEGYRRNISEMDISNRTITRYTYEYKDVFSSYNNIEDLRLDNTDKFIDTVTNKQFEDSFVLKDYAGPNDNNAGLTVNYDRAYPYYPEIMSTKPVFHHHLNYNKMRGHVSGRYDLFPGDLINITIPEFSVNSMENFTGIPDVDNSGLNIVLGLHHLIENNKWRTYIEYSKGGKAGGPQSRPNEAAGPILREQVRPGSAIAEPFAGDQTYAAVDPEVGGLNPRGIEGQGQDIQSVTEAGATNSVTGVNGTPQPINLSASPSNNEGRAAAEAYLGRPMSNSEWEYLVRTTAGETGQLNGSLASTPEERANVAAVILNRVKSSSYPNTVDAVVKQSSQFAPVTGWSGNGYQATSNFLAPSQAQIDAVTSNIAQNLNNVNTYHLNFTANNLDAYRDEGTNSGFIQDVARDPNSRVIGQHIFGTA